MRKVFFFLLFVAAFLLTGCYPKSGVVTCSNRMEKDNVVMDTDYQITYSDHTVLALHTVEKIITSDDTILKKYQTILESNYRQYNELDGYHNEILLKKGSLISITDIDYSMINLDKLFEIDSNNASLVRHGKIDFLGMKKVYENMGAICKYKVSRKN